ncbi:DNA polymerase II large subunit [Candidatus Bathyarchaeota archaeon]|nr:DNA polymerase II large subunit [Candidatus Bathyarchaeota archaeon]
MQLASDDYQRYFLEINQTLQSLYEIARKARRCGYDPTFEPEPHIALDLAERVEGLVGPPGVANRIRELNGILKTREEVAFKIAEEIVYGKFGHLDEQRAADQAVRTALAILTEGITAAPLQGIAQVSIKVNPDRTRYLAIYFAGPIRSAGGTEAALTLVIGDFIRRLIGVDRYKPTDEEIGRFIEELRLYEREVSRFQYHVLDESLENALRSLPIEVTGTETDPVEVSSFRNLPRIETNRVRGGALRVINDGIIGRSSKVWKSIELLGIDGWDWLKRVREFKEDVAEEATEFMYMEDVIAGRPIFSFPSWSGGFRLRYGRSRNTGLAAVGLHPATMSVLQNFLAIGTQLRIEKPGKAGLVAPVDTIEPPIVKLKDGSVTRVETVEEAERVRNSIEKILFLGDILISFGDFLENNKPLAPSGFTEEWWGEELLIRIKKTFNGSIERAATATDIPQGRLESFLTQPIKNKPTPEEAIKLTTALNVPLHPRYTYFWDDITVDELLKLRSILLGATKTVEGRFVKKITAEFNQEIKDILERLCVPHKVSNNIMTIDSDAPTLAFSLRLDNPKLKVKSTRSTLEAVKELAGADIRCKVGTYIGARMGRPEKAKKREMSPPVHVLFPIGLAGGPHRDLAEAARKEVIQVEIVRRRCPSCNNVTINLVCPHCGVETSLEKVCPNCGRTINEEICPVCKGRARYYERRQVNVSELLRYACKKLGEDKPIPVKAVKGLMSETRTPELIEKGILRAKHGLTVFKDGTTRFDATNAPLTHFMPSEIGVSIDKLRCFGYIYDQDGNELRDPQQICELKVQDVIIPVKCARYLVQVAQFLDELLEKVYGLQPYYKVNRDEDLLGHLIIGLAPHTSAGVIGRIIGFTKANVCYAHPLWHTAKRRDCDGDEDAIMLALDPLINFSKFYLPAQIGGMMDAPLLLNPIINPSEVGHEALNVDVASKYPLIFYESTLKAISPKVMAKLIDLIGHRLSTSAQFQAMHYTHFTTDINAGNYESAYKKLGAMLNKMDSQLALAEKIRAVDAKAVAKRVLTTHLIRDIAGNLKAFSTQSFRCKRCNLKYRRIPLRGQCLKCGGQLVPTVYRGGIEKYLNAAANLAKKYGIEDYYRQRITIIEDELTLLFKAPKAKQVSLGEFM